MELGAGRTIAIPCSELPAPRRSENIMPHLKVKVSCPIPDSFRVQQVAGMFDVPLSDHAVERFDVDIPDEREEWQIGLIVGPSGSGKSTIAHQAFGNRLYTTADWPADRAVV